MEKTNLEADRLHLEFKDCECRYGMFEDVSLKTFSVLWILENGLPKCGECNECLEFTGEILLEEEITASKEMDTGKKSINGKVEVPWSYVAFGDKVYIAGNLVEGKPTCVYGPHIVIDPQKQLLVNSRGRTFYERWPKLYMDSRRRR